MPLLTTAPRFLSRSACSRRGHYSPLRRKCRRASAGLFSGLRGSLCRGSRRLRASVTLCLFATRSLFPAPPEIRRAGKPVFRLRERLRNAAAHDGSALLCCHAARPPRWATARPSAKNTLRLRRNCFFACGSRCFPAPGRSALLCRGGLWPPAGGCGHPACIFSLPMWPRPRLPLRRTPRRGPISTVYTARSFM